MLLASQVIAVLFGIALTFLFYQAIGTRKGGLIYTRQDRDAWTAAVGDTWLTWLTRASIMGTLTSLATVYLFFIGSARVFGGWVFFCVLTLALGAPVTNWVTTRVAQSPRFTSIFKTNDQVSGVIASLFWSDTQQGRTTSRLVKIITLLNIAGVIWLEFALFADLGTRIVGNQNIFFQLAILFVSCWAIVYFTVRYGLRGFVFADVFHAPLILFSTLVLLVGVVAFLPQVDIPPLSATFYKPILTTGQCLIFVAHVFCLNTFLVLLTEAHWMRTWLLPHHETSQQISSIIITSLAWGLLILVGLYAAHLTGAVGEQAVVGMLNKLGAISIFFPLCFWLGGVAALFSTADPQIYGFLLLRSFDPNTGTLKQLQTTPNSASTYAAITATLFCVLYAVVRKLGWPLEKIVFLIIPLTLTILPGFVYLIFGRLAKPAPIITSFLLYIVFAIAGLAAPEWELGLTLSAALCPVAIALIMYIYYKRIRRLPYVTRHT